MDDHRFTGDQIIVAEGSARPPAIGAGPIERSSMVRAVLPCGDCLHREVCLIRPLLDEEDLQYRIPPAPHPAIRIQLAATITCDHHLPDPTYEPPSAPRAPFVPQVRTEAARRAGRNGAFRRKERQAPPKIQTKAGPRAPRSDGAPSYADATNEALRSATGHPTATARALGLKGGSSAVTSRIKAMRLLGLIPDDVEALIAAAAAERGAP